uniref:Uncharacterized protein n=1 Tax=Candidatus Kentrum sp. SD TaxID=2126332 RepID=A0A451BKD6_9GAMM|nr:MAG: hypothetical protein BECKSD772D_GA0070982_102414 [Candidatus Kentron sp. SD]
MQPCSSLKILSPDWEVNLWFYFTNTCGGMQHFVRKKPTTGFELLFLCDKIDFGADWDFDSNRRQYRRDMPRPETALTMAGPFLYSKTHPGREQ